MMKPGDIYSGILDGEAMEIKIQEGPFRITTAGVPVQQCRVIVLTGPRSGELHQWGVSYIERTFPRKVPNGS